MDIFLMILTGLAFFGGLGLVSTTANMLAIDLEAVKKAFGDGQEALATLREALVKAQEGTDQDAIKAAQKAYQEKKAEVSGLVKAMEEKVEEAKELARANAATKAIDDLTQTATAGMSSLGGPRVAATPNDYMERERVHIKSFVQALTDKDGAARLGDQQRDMIRVKSDKFAEGQTGFRAPESIRQKMLGPRVIKMLSMELEDIAMPMSRNALPNKSSDTDMGYLVPQDFRAMVLQLPTEEPHLVTRATVLNSTTGTVTIPRLQQTTSDYYGGFVAEWTSEGGSKPAADPVFEQVTISTHELSLYTEFTHRMLARSAIDLVAFIGNLGQRSLMATLDTALTTGSGTGQPTGIVNTAGIQTVSRTTASEVNHEDLVDLKYKLAPPIRANGTFLVEDAVMQHLEKKVDSDDRPLFSLNTSTGAYDRLVGKPYMPTTRLNSLGSDGDIVFADLTEYYVAMEDEIVFRRSDDYKFRNNVASFAIYLVAGGEMVQPLAGAILDEAAS